MVGGVDWRVDWRVEAGGSPLQVEGRLEVTSTRAGDQYGLDIHRGVQKKLTSKVYINLSIAADSGKTGHILTNRLPLEVSFKTPGNRTFKRRQLSPKQMIGATENTKMLSLIVKCLPDTVSPRGTPGCY